MKLADILNATKASSSLSLFNLKTIRAVETALLEKNGKYYLKCPVRGKEIQVKPEEVVRQLWIQRLLLDYGYSLSRLAWVDLNGNAIPGKSADAPLLARWEKDKDSDVWYESSACHSRQVCCFYT